MGICCNPHAHSKLFSVSHFNLVLAFLMVVSVCANSHTKVIYHMSVTCAWIDYMAHSVEKSWHIAAGLSHPSQMDNGGFTLFSLVFPIMLYAISMHTFYPRGPTQRVIATV